MLTRIFDVPMQFGHLMTTTDGEARYRLKGSLSRGDGGVPLVCLTLHQMDKPIPEGWNCNRDDPEKPWTEYEHWVCPLDEAVRLVGWLAGELAAQLKRDAPQATSGNCSACGLPLDRTVESAETVRQIARKACDEERHRVSGLWYTLERGLEVPDGEAPAVLAKIIKYLRGPLHVDAAESPR